jgi:hypothetical protein
MWMSFIYRSPVWKAFDLKNFSRLVYRLGSMHSAAITELMPHIGSDHKPHDDAGKGQPGCYPLETRFKLSYNIIAELEHGNPSCFQWYLVISL